MAHWFKSAIALGTQSATASDVSENVVCYGVSGVGDGVVGDGVGDVRDGVVGDGVGDIGERADGDGVGDVGDGMSSVMGSARLATVLSEDGVW